jgi:mannitol-specific phosphotransferase system IIBC component
MTEEKMTPEKLQSIIEATIGKEFENYWFYLILSVAVALISSFLVQYLKEKGKNLAKKEDITDLTAKVEDVQKSYKIEFDEIQKKNDLIFSELKESQNRYNSRQFELYNELWSSLIDLKFSADNLWNSATAENLKRFSTNLNSAKISIEKSSLLIEDNHYKELMKIIEKFEEYGDGKTKLIQIRNQTIDEVKGLAYHFYIKNLIEENETFKISYDNLLVRLKKQFKNTIRGESSNKSLERNI